MAVAFGFDSNTRGGGRPPLYAWEKVGPLQVAAAHGTHSPQWTSFLFQNTIGTQAQQIGIQVHNLNQTPPGPTPTVSYVQFFIVQAADVSVAAWTEILNIGLAPTETWWTPSNRPYTLYPGEILLGLNTSGQAMSTYIDVYTPT